jgi:hypothetical protein
MNETPNKKAYALARVAMGDSRTVDHLASPDLVEAFEATRSAAQALDALVDFEARELERRIGAEADLEIRRRLIRRRRGICHRAGLSIDSSDEARRVLAGIRALKGAEETLVRTLKDNTATSFAGPGQEGHIGRESLWLLGSNTISIGLANQLGSHYSHSLFLRKTGESIKGWEQQQWFKPFINRTNSREKEIKGPSTSVAVAGFCTRSGSKAKRLLSSITSSAIVPLVYGSPSRRADQFALIAGTLNVDEIMFLDLSVGHDDRLKSLELIADEMID